MSSKIIITLEDLKCSMGVFEKIYDAMRIIDPVKKKIINYSDGVLNESPFSCYDFWAQGKVCSNCISMRAFNEKDAFIKLGWVGNKIYLVLAVPVQDDSETLILELMKDVSGCLLVDPSEEVKNNNLLRTLNEIGQLQIRDSLTGILNRRFIDESLPANILNNSVGLFPYGIIFADIDHFKLVNDTYGHIAGDFVLKEFAGLLQESLVGHEGWAARYGGEEFLIYLKDKSKASVKKFAEALRSRVENYEFNYEGNKIKITSSFGVCFVHKNFNIRMEELVDGADKNLYKAKYGGRNRVVASEL